ncbi:hypothetical protein Astex_3556 (plasmid) [Asticcacaulis excentricus CB 48]|uniref:Uncharacterized protein n=1 Tax=Asticcacaulis excentricus (strain ATCC 15261 / DSM 4724 / KCTC 12464 / NCIMB 9791 / VKM B-1370 / CB 48) TaxID=573065 RepID=E8RVL6_ASTEC|nr:hypothetical protein Astex_3556 [Asticcacaulis excentricus CB 48]
MRAMSSANTKNPAKDGGVKLKPFSAPIYSKPHLSDLR